MITARKIKSDVDYHEVGGLNEGQVDRLYNETVQLEQDFRMALQLHHFESIPSIRDPETMAYYELRALQECLLKASGRGSDLSWRERIWEEVPDREMAGRILEAAVVSAPCGGNFHAGAFQALVSAIDVEVAKRLGGALFPVSPDSGEPSDQENS